MRASAQVINQWYNQALTLQKRGKYEPALPLLQKVVKVIPNHFAAWNMLGLSYLELRQYDRAYQCLEESLKWCPEFYPAAVNLAQVLIRKGLFKEAHELINSLIASYPDVSKLHMLRYQLERHNLNCAGARSAIAQYVATLTSEDSDNVDRDCCNWHLMHHLDINEFLDGLTAEKDILKELTNHIQELKETVKPVSGLPATIPNTIFYLAYYDVNPKKYLSDIADLYRSYFPELTWTSPHCNYKIPKGKKIYKVGVVSSYLDKFHAVGFTFAPLVKALKEAGLEIVYFRLPTENANVASTNYNDQLGKVRCIDVPNHLHEARRVIASQEVDILWYTDINMTQQTYFLAFSRLAPIQCVSGGHPTTSGIDTIDYYLLSAVLDAGDSESRYTEKLYKLPTYPAIYEDFPFTQSSLGRKHFGLPEDKNLYYCSQTLFKIHPKMDQAFREILEKDEKALLVFSYAKTPFATLLEKRLQKSLGTLSERCLFLEPVPQHQFFLLLQQFDVLLDTFPFSGGNTACQAIAMGVPMVTLESDEMRGSVATALYRQMKINDCLAKNVNDYIEKSLKIATNKDYRLKLSQDILTKKHLIFNQQQEIVKAYLSAFTCLYDSLKEVHDDSSFKAVANDH